MANESKGGTSAELDDLAFQIYAQRVAGQPAKRNGEQDAIEAYRKAEAFLSARSKIRSGGVAQQEAPQGADCCAPNLPKTHPHNLVSRRMGDLPRVKRIKEWLDKNPTPESDPGELVFKLNSEMGLSWDLPTINTARAIFPAYAKN